MRVSRVIASAVLVGAIILVPTVAMAAPQADQVQNVGSHLGSGAAECTNMGMMDTNVAMGSTFTPGITGLLTGIDFPVTLATTEADLLVEVFATEAGVPVGSAIATQTVWAEDLASLINGGTMRVRFTTAANVVAGQTYGFAFEFPTCTFNARLGFLTVTPESDTKTHFEHDSRGWLGYSFLGMNFTTYVDAPGSEASSGFTPTLAQTGRQDSSGTLALGGAGIALGLGVLLFARRRFAASRG